MENIPQIFEDITPGPNLKGKSAMDYVCHILYIVLIIAVKTLNA